MSKKRKNKLEIGKFYIIYVGKSHPGYLFEYDEKHKTYKALKFGTTKGKHMIEIHPIQPNKTYTQYVEKRPFEGVRVDFGDRELVQFSINSSDYLLFEDIKKRKTNKSRRAKERYKKCR